MGESHWLTDPRFKDDASRAENGQEINERMSRWCAERSSSEIVDTLGKAMIPAAPVLKPQEILDDPHVRAVGFLEAVDYPGLERGTPVARAAVSLSDTPGSIRHRAPLLGEHTDEILAELGYSAEQIRGLRADAVI